MNFDQHNYTFPKLTIISLDNLNILASNLQVIRPIILKYRNDLDGNLQHDTTKVNTLLDMLRLLLLDCQKQIDNRKERCGY